MIHARGKEKILSLKSKKMLKPGEDRKLNDLVLTLRAEKNPQNELKGKILVILAKGERGKVLGPRNQLSGVKISWTLSANCFLKKCRENL